MVSIYCTEVKWAFIIFLEKKNEKKTILRQGDFILHFGQYSLGSRRWSRAVGSGRWLSLGRFPWWCHSSHIPAEYKDLWTRIDREMWGRCCRDTHLPSVTRRKIADYLLIGQTHFLQDAIKVEFLNRKLPEAKKTFVYCDWYLCVFPINAYKGSFLIFIITIIIDISRDPV